MCRCFFNTMPRICSISFFWILWNLFNAARHRLPQDKKVMFLCFIFAKSLNKLITEIIQGGILNLTLKSSIQRPNLNFSRFKPALNWNWFLVFEKLNSLNSDSVLSEFQAFRIDSLWATLSRQTKLNCNVFNHNSFD